MLTSPKNIQEAVQYELKELESKPKADQVKVLLAVRRTINQQLEKLSADVVKMALRSLGKLNNR